MSCRIAHRIAAFSAVALLSAVLLNGCDRTPPQPAPSGPVLRARFDLSEGFPLVVPVTFDDNEYRFVFDTGCSVTSMSNIHIDLLGPHVRDVNSTGSLNQTTTMSYHEIGEGKHLIVGGLNVAGLVGVSDYSLLTDWMTDYDGLLGMDVLGRFTVQLDFDDSTIRIIESTVADPCQWGHPFDIYIKGGTPHIDLQLPGGLTESFMIDTASPRCYLRQEIFTKLARHLDPDTDYSPEPITARTSSLDAIKLADYELAPLIYDKILLCEYARSFVGMEFLRLHRSVTFDFPNAKMYLMPGTADDTQ